LCVKLAKSSISGAIIPGPARLLARGDAGAVVASARIISALTGIHTGPRQFELPPNMPLSDSAGR
jgi:hypothetical protein